MRTHFIFFFLFLSFCGFLIFYKTAFSYDLTMSELNSWLKERKEGKRKFILIDVRTPQEHNDGYIPGTDKLIPHDEIEQRYKELEGISRDTTIVLYCRSGRRSEIAKKKLIELGFKNVLNAGGIKQWLNSGFELVK